MFIIYNTAFDVEMIYIYIHIGTVCTSRIKDQFTSNLQPLRLKQVVCFCVSFDRCII